MPTEEIAARDAYQARAEGHVEEVTADGVVLDRTVFYARGGGQPGDVGVFSTPNGNVA
ncbi:MAG TPA: alanine--tRNA ligase-related protein, partial [Acidimicrobiia bacterium]